MGDRRDRADLRSPTVSDFYSILGIKDLCKGFRRWYPNDKNASNNNDAKDECRGIRDEADKVLREKVQEEITISEPTSTFQTREDGFFQRSTLLSRTTSRRCKTPTPSRSHRTLSRNASRRSTTPTSLSSDMRRRNTTPTPLSRNASRRSVSESASPTFPATGIEGVSPQQTSVPPSLSRNSTSKRITTPILFSQSTPVLKKPPLIEKKIECTLEELRDGCIKKIKITRDSLLQGIMVEDEEVLTIEVKPGWRKGTKITFEGKGGETPGFLPADIAFVIEEKRHPVFRRDGDDLEMEVEIDLVKALTGCSITVPLIGGESMSFSIDSVIFPGFEKVIRGQGMPDPMHKERRGDVRIKFQVRFPLDLSDEQRSQASRILQDCSYM